MHPTLIELPIAGGLQVYPTMTALAYVLGVTIGWRAVRRLGFDAGWVLDFAFWIAVWMLVGGRALYILVNAATYRDDPSRLLRVWEGGLVYYGSAIAAAGTIAWFCRRRQISFFELVDVALPSLALLHFLQRIGCFAAGCCFGRPGDIPWAVHFPAGSDPYRAFAGQALHPTQLYESVAVYLVFLLLLWVRKNKRFHGQVLLAYLMIYAVTRSLIEVFRGDTRRGFVVDGVLSTSQFISALVFLVAAGIWVFLRRQRARGTGAAAAPRV